LPVGEGVVARDGVARGADAVVEVAGDGVDAEGHGLDREAQLGGGALEGAGGARSDDDDGASEVGELRVWGGTLLDGVGEGVAGLYELGSASSEAAAAVCVDQVLEWGGSLGGARCCCLALARVSVGV
jgi:hypothetical protein